jgi:hypothetical protein
MLDDLQTTRHRLFAGDTHASVEIERSIDVADEVTTAGSTLRQDQSATSSDSVAVARL